MFDAIKALAIDLIPGGTAITQGPEVFDQFKNGSYMAAMMGVLGIILDEGARCFPPAKVAKFADGAVTNYKAIKGVLKALENAKRMGQDFVIKMYNLAKSKLGDNLLKRFRWLGKPDGAKIFGESAADWWDDILEIFGGVEVFSYNNRPVFKLFPLPGPGNTCVYASLYPDSSTGHAWSIGFYSGPCDPSERQQMLIMTNPVWKVRFDIP